jgi:hypothetical protein
VALQRGPARLEVTVCRGLSALAGGPRGQPPLPPLVATEPEVLVVTELEAAVLVDVAAPVDATGVVVEELAEVFVRLVGAELAAAVLLPAALLVPVKPVAATAVLGTRAKARTPEAATAPSAPTVVAARTLR